MKTVYFSPLMLVLAAGAVFAQDEKYVGITGSETPAFLRFSDAGNCFVFAKYVVKTDKIDADGENIGVYRRRASASDENACQTKGDAYLYIKDTSSNSFFGLAGAYLFIYSGTSTTDGGVEIYNLTTRTSIITEAIVDDAKLIDGRFLDFDSPSDKKGPLSACKEAAKWKPEGGGVGWKQAKKLDLQTMKVISTGTLRCYYME